MRILINILLCLFCSGCAQQKHNSNTPLKIGQLYRHVNYLRDSTGKNVAHIFFLYTKSRDTLYVYERRHSNSYMKMGIEEQEGSLYIYKLGKTGVLRCGIQVDSHGLITYASIDGYNQPQDFTNPKMTLINLLCCNHNPKHCCRSFAEAVVLSKKNKCVWQ